ncbi:hypothetical protein ACQCSX_13215 [Pseudarthrobacter sp. P1]|uniref:hypothetical protein n=1 Tax=Pseudarthrobacter sp. P1 TaxID=3418418 RepID=UPI003CEEFFE7
MGRNAILTPLVKDRMLALGFRKRAGLVFTMELAPDILGIADLNAEPSRSAEGVWDTHPVLGIRHQEAARIVAQLTGVRPHPYKAPPVAASLGYLMPEQKFTTWPLGGFPAAEANAAAMVDAVRGHGLPFLLGHSSREALLRAINQRIGSPETQNRTRPVLLALMGRYEEAARAMSALADSPAAAGSPAAEGHRLYAANFFPWLEARAAGAETGAGTDA